MCELTESLFIWLYICSQFKNSFDNFLYFDKPKKLLFLNIVNNKSMSRLLFFIHN